MIEDIVKMVSMQEQVSSEEIIPKIRESVSEEINTKVMNIEASIGDLKSMMRNFINQQPQLAKVVVWCVFLLVKDWL